MWKCTSIAYTTEQIKVFGWNLTKTISRRIIGTICICVIFMQMSLPLQNRLWSTYVWILTSKTFDRIFYSSFWRYGEKMNFMQMKRSSVSFDTRLRCMAWFRFSNNLTAIASYVKPKKKRTKCVVITKCRCMNEARTKWKQQQQQY